MAKQKPTKAQVAYGKARAGGQNPMRITAKDVKRTARAAAEAALLAVPIGKGVKIGQVAGKAVARALAKEASPKIASAANKARGAGKMVNPKPAMGKVERTAAKRDVVVKSDDKTYALNRFIDKSGRQSVKVRTNKPSVRTIEKEVTTKQASQRTASANKLRRGAAKAEAARGKAAIESSSILRKAGGTAGAVAGSAPAAAKVKSQNKKKK